eukprot:gene35107-40853_t
MLLEVGVEEALPLLSSPQLLGSKVQEALAVLKVYEKAYEVEEVRCSHRQ